jgi:hypothetical protein
MKTVMVAALTVGLVVAAMYFGAKAGQRLLSEMVVVEPIESL